MGLNIATRGNISIFEWFRCLWVFSLRIWNLYTLKITYFNIEYAALKKKGGGDDPEMTKYVLFKIYFWEENKLSSEIWQSCFKYFFISIKH